MFKYTPSNTLYSHSQLKVSAENNRSVQPFVFRMLVDPNCQIIFRPLDVRQYCEFATETF